MDLQPHRGLVPITPGVIQGLSVYTRVYYPAIKKKKKKENLPFVTIWINSIILSEVSHTEKDKYCMVSLICVI